jgi:phosphate transport system substrate-binding protein
MSRARTIAGLACALACGWSALSVKDAGGAPPPVPRPASSLELRGSGAMGLLARALAESYMAEHPDVVVTVETSGAYQGLKGLIIGTCDVAMGTDEIPEELVKLARDRGVTLKRTLVYSDALAAVVHPENKVQDLTREQLRDLFRGAVTNWKEVGGDDAPVEILTLNPTSAAYEVFKRRVLGDDAVMTPKATLVNLREMKEKLGTHAIGYLGLGQLGRLEARALTIGGVAGTPATVESSAYPIVRHMALYQREPVLPLADSVIATFLSPAKGQKLILDAGNVPVK